LPGRDLVGVPQRPAYIVHSLDQHLSSLRVDGERDLLSQRIIDAPHRRNQPRMTEPDQIPIRCTILRGGTSKGVYLLEQDIPPAGEKRDRLLKRIMGTPDILQIDGLGGARLITSKMAIIKRSSRPDADVDYTYAQVVLERDLIMYSSNCGNISSGVGPFAIDAGLVEITEPITRVRIHNVNTGKILVAHVPVAGGRARVTGDFPIDGVPGTGAEIRMDYAGTIGAKTGKILPTGRAVDNIDLENGEKIEVTLCDVANPCVFVRADAVGLEGSELPDRFASDDALIDRLREVRGKAAEKLGFCADWRDVDRQSPALPDDNGRGAEDISHDARPFG
jgi:2-methylaconitate cis-trans-isomerase PrpF